MSEALKADLATRAEALGFALCRVARCAPAPHGEALLAWIADGRHGEMAWMERTASKRTDPRSVLPGAASVVVLGMNYWQGGAGPTHGRIARYAWGDDYHALIEQRLETLDQYLQSLGGIQKCYVDTGPILERDFAAKAGLGWQGKSTMLIHPKRGTWLFLCAILTTLDLEPDAPMVDHCGRCTRCIDACPTAAITAPLQLDARRCISYLTIENKGSIPEEFRTAIGDRIYGCDDCLDACPWNRFASASRETAFQLRPALADMHLRDFLALDDETFRSLFRNSPIKRIKRRGLLRNVCVALGNVGTSQDLPMLERAVADLEPLIVEHASWAIQKIQARLAVAKSGGNASLPAHDG